MTRHFLLRFLLVAAFMSFANTSNNSASLYNQENISTETTGKKSNSSNKDNRHDFPIDLTHENHHAHHTNHHPHHHDDDELFTRFHFDRICKRRWITCIGIMLMQAFLAVLHAGIILQHTCSAIPGLDTCLMNWLKHFA